MPGIGADVPAAPAAAAAGPWARDVRVQTTTALTTTGGTVWGAAHRAVAFLEAAAGDIGMARPGVRILELGAGCGLLGLTLARNLPGAAEVCLTEQAAGGALAHLRANMALNAGMPGAARVTTAACDWTLVMAGGQGQRLDGQRQPEEQQQQQTQEQEQQQVTGEQQQEQQQLTREQQQQQQQQQQQDVEQGEFAGAAGDAAEEAADAARLLSTRWDFIVGSDLVYNEAGTHMLPRVIRALALAGRPPPPPRPPAGGPPAPPTAPSPPNGGQAAVFYSHTKHRYDTCDIAFQEQCAAAGLELEEVWEPGAARPPPSPPPLAALFGDMRVAVWRITVAGEPGELPAPEFW